MYCHQPTSVADFTLRGNQVKLLISYLQKPCFLNFGFGRFGGLNPGNPPPPLGCAPSFTSFHIPFQLSVLYAAAVTVSLNKPSTLQTLPTTDTQIPRT